MEINEYREYIKKRNFTQNPSFYRLRIDGGGLYSDNEFICYPDSISLPGRNFLNTPFSYFGPEFNLPLRREYTDFLANFIVYQDWTERKFFENWMDSILPHTPAVTSDAIPSNFLNQLRTIEIDFLNRRKNGTSNATNFSIKLIDCYPSLITPSVFSGDNSGYALFTVNFTYHHYEIANQGPVSPVKGNL